MRLARWLADQSIRRQLVLTVALVHALLMAAFIVDLVARQRAFLHAEYIERSTALAQGLARHASGALMAGDVAGIQEAVAGFDDYPDLRYAFVTDPAGRVLAHSDRRQVGRYVADPRGVGMLAGPRRVRVLFESAAAVDIAAPVLWRGRLVGWTRFGVGLQSIDRALADVARKGAAYGLGAVVLGVLLALWTANRLTARVYELLRVTEATRGGRRDLRARPAKVNEVGRLAASFNQMLDALSDRETALARANDELESNVAQRTAELAESVATHRSILQQANDAFVSIDEQGRIVEWNGAAVATFGWSRDEALGKALSELMIPPAQRSAHHAGMARYLAGGPAVIIGRRVEVKALTRDGAEIPVELSVRARVSAGQTFFDAFMHDISGRKALQESLARQALHDDLTGLPNRRLLHEHLPAALQRADRSGKALAVLYLDLDRFKQVNDSLGHEAGDEVLRQFAHRIRASVRSVDTVARLAGDEFVVVCEALTNAPSDVLRIATKVLAASGAPYDLGERREALSSSIGVALYDVGSDVVADELLLRADKAMYASKRRGRGVATLWEPAMGSGHGDGLAPTG